MGTPVNKQQINLQLFVLLPMIVLGIDVRRVQTAGACSPASSPKPLCEKAARTPMAYRWPDGREYSLAGVATHQGTHMFAMSGKQGIGKNICVEEWTVELPIPNVRDSCTRSIWIIDLMSPTLPLFFA